MSAKPLLRDVTRLKVVHRQRVNRHGDAEPAPAFSPEGLRPQTIASAGDGWQALLATEYESVVIAGWMTAALARIGAPLDFVGAFGRVVEDEIRHVDICAQMVESFGATPLIPPASPPPFPTQAATERAATIEIITGMVSFFCVFEHLSGLIFAQAIEAAHDERAKWALGEIFRDEAFHGAFGFETAKYYVPGWSEAERTALAARVIDDIRRFERRISSRPSSDALSPELAALEKLGLLGTPTLLTTFYAGVEKELIPRLADIGVTVAIA